MVLNFDDTKNVLDDLSALERLGLCFCYTSDQSFKVHLDIQHPCGGLAMVPRHRPPF